MNIVSRIRIGIYVAVAIVLAALLFLGEGGLLSSSGIRNLPLFRVSDNASISFQNDPRGVTPREPAADTATPKEGRDDFDAALRGLSSEDSLEAAGVPRNPPTALPTPTTFVEENVPDEEGPIDDEDDARAVSSGIETAPPNPFDGSGVLGGVVSRSGGLGTPLPLDTPVRTPTNLRPWAGGQARGYTMLYAMQPEARPVVETNVNALLSAQIREPYIGVLIDGTFGRDFGYLKQIIARLSADERALTVVLYLSNGPHMRKGGDVPSGALFARIDPLEFRARIRREAQLQNQFEAVAVQAKDIFTYNASLNPANSNVAVVMLEDNLEVASYRAMRDLAAKHLTGVADFVRNPCVGCFAGNDDALLGSSREEHDLSRFGLLREGDGYSFDGVGFRYPNTSGGIGASAAQVESLMSKAINQRLRYVGLWRHAWQGVEESATSFSQVSTRNYVLSSAEEVEFEIEALRMGLLEETAEE